MLWGGPAAVWQQLLQHLRSEGIGTVPKCPVCVACNLMGGLEQPVMIAGSNGGCCDRLSCCCCRQRH